MHDFHSVETSRGTWTSPDDATVARLLKGARTIAVVGASGSETKASNGVLRYLQATGSYELWPVNPRGGEIHGLTVYRSLDELPGVPDLVDVFRPSEELAAVAEDAVRIGAPAFWAQLDLHSDEAVRVAYEAGLEVVTDRCIKPEHARLIGG